MKIFDTLLAEGNRKTLMSLIAIIITVVTEHYTGPLSHQALDALVAIVGIFAGGNVAEHFANALKMKYSGPVMQGEPPVPSQREEAPQTGPSVQQVAEYAQRIANDTTNQFKQVHELLAKQANSIDGLVKAINNRPPQAPPAGQEQW